MKTKPFIIAISLALLIISFFVFSLTSCTNEVNVSSYKNPTLSSDEMAYEALYNQIDSIAVLNYGQVQSTRSWGSFWSGLKRILIADAIGAAKGLIVGNCVIDGVAASLGKTVEIILSESETSPDSISAPVESMEYSLNDIVLTGSSEYVDSIGYYHNQIIQNIFAHNSNLNIWQGLSTARIANVVKNTVDNDYNPNEQVLLEDLIEDVAYDENIDDETYDFFSDNFEDFCEYFIQEDPQIAPQLITIARFIDNMQSFDDVATMRTYYEQAVQLVNQSTISSNSKTVIKVGLSVAFASAKLWDEDQIGELIGEGEGIE